MQADVKLRVVDWLDSIAPAVSRADPLLLKEFVLELLKELSPYKGRDDFVERVCVLVDEIVEDKEVFAGGLYDVVVAQPKRQEDTENWVTIYDIPQQLCKRKLILKEFEQFGEVCDFKLSGSFDQPRRNALIRFVSGDAVSACLRSTVPFFNDRFVQVDTMTSVEPEKLPRSTPFGQLSTQLNVKSKQLGVYREQLREIQNRLESTNPKDAYNLKHCYNLYQEFIETLEKKQLTPALLYRLQDKLHAIKNDPKTYVKPKRLNGERLRT